MFQCIEKTLLIAPDMSQLGQSSSLIGKFITLYQAPFYYIRMHYAGNGWNASTWGKVTDVETYNCGNMFIDFWSGELPGEVGTKDWQTMSK